MRLPNIFEADTPPVSFPAGTVIFSEGEGWGLLYVVKEGEVELKVKGRLVEVVKAEGFFGEMAIIENGPRTATATASVDCELIPINEKRFEFMVHEVPNFAIHVMRGLSRRLRSVDEGG